ncbi:TPA: hypothetical protein ACFP41_001904 [Neisseria weaveri]
MARPNCPAHDDFVTNLLSFEEAYQMLSMNPSTVFKTSAGNEFTALATVTTKGSHKGKKVIRFLRNGGESARAYECCWGHKTNCNRTFIDCYTKVLK